MHNAVSINAAAEICKYIDMFYQLLCQIRRIFILTFFQVKNKPNNATRKASSLSFIRKQLKM